MRLYFDTAYIAKRYLHEPDGARVWKLAARAAGLYSSALCMAEMACVFQRLARESRITPDEAAEMRAFSWTTFVTGFGDFSRSCGRSCLGW